MKRSALPAAVVAVAVALSACGGAEPEVSQDCLVFTRLASGNMNVKNVCSTAITAIGMKKGGEFSLGPGESITIPEDVVIQIGQ